MQPSRQRRTSALGDSCDEGAHPKAARRSVSRAAYTDEQLVKAAANFRALGDPERLRILAFLAEGQTCVSDIARALGGNLSTVSQRLKVLRAEEVIVRRRSGKHIFYALADDHVRALVRNALEHAAPNH